MNSHDLQARQFRQSIQALERIYGKGNVRQVPNGALASKVEVTIPAGKISLRWASKPCRCREVQEPHEALLPEPTRAHVYTCPGLGGMGAEVYLGVQVGRREDYWMLDTSSAIGRALAFQMRARRQESPAAIVEHDLVETYRGEMDLL